ncbi:hypothetical protein B7P43_G07780 [Cryptotermes secundus]|uniref:Voltage-dependent calcium channel alpha-2/delta subunit conserved region domain-containing protein n=3 Tax=Cryptotermes secundus TaxID=105785 RepID=A0A2J7QJI5_9NEOP|nr:hypothetical protein B7P43_G07780 [Cryptotermes secundus]PNF28752.1 hypothetical protein B7P43_G07780 [Cryptotermes secundus]
MNSAPYPKVKMDSCYCDVELLNSLIHDAIETRFWSKRNIIMKQDKFIKEFGVTVVFLATHSGLTRWQPFQDNTETSDFKETHTHTIDEVWYQRAVDLQDKGGTFVYSVPFSDGRGDNSSVLVTASYAVFTEDKKVPLAVLGYQFEHFKLFSEFYSITSKCTGCTSCSSDELMCYILDNNGFIVVSEEISETGKFFGEVEGNVMKMLIQEKVFRKVQIIDYQAICLREDESTSHASLLITPMQHFHHMLEWLIGTTVWLFAEISPWHGSLTDAAKVKPTQLPKEYARINRTHLEPCIKELDLYQLQNITYMNTKVISSSSCSQYTVVQKLSHSNLILVVVDGLCSDDSWTNVRIKMEVKDSNIFCMKATKDELARKRPKTCIGRDNKAEKLQEPHIAECGCHPQFEVDIFLMLICWCVGVISSTQH